MLATGSAGSSTSSALNCKRTASPGKRFLPKKYAIAYVPRLQEVDGSKERKAGQEDADQHDLLLHSVCALQPHSACLLAKLIFHASRNLSSISATNAAGEMSSSDARSMPRAVPLARGLLNGSCPCWSRAHRETAIGQKANLLLAFASAEAKAGCSLSLEAAHKVHTLRPNPNWNFASQWNSNTRHEQGTRQSERERESERRKENNKNKGTSVLSTMSEMVPIFNSKVVCQRHSFHAPFLCWRGLGYLIPAEQLPPLSDWPRAQHVGSENWQRKLLN